MEAATPECSEPAPATPARGPVQTDAELAAYYEARAPEMEEAYAVPERQADLKRLRAELRSLVAGREVLEVACGTGYWTQVMAETARSIVATDLSESMLAQARAKTCGPAPVVWQRADAWRLETLPGRFTVGAALFWWSHLPRSRIRGFLEHWHEVLQPGAVVIMADNLPADCRRTPAVRVDAEGNTYQRRRLRSGAQFEIIKNYPGEAEIRAALLGLAEAVEYRPFTCMWLLTYRTRRLL